jgi:hypothetical protein
MQKIVFILLLLFLSCTDKKPQQTNYAQEETKPKKFIYADTDEVAADEVINDSAAIIPIEETTSTVVADTIEVDTTVYYSELVMAKDSVEAWKNLKSFAYVKYLDSLLKVQKEKTKQEAVTNKEFTSRGSSWLDNLLSSSGLQLILWLLAGTFVIFILYKLFITDGALRRNKKTTIANTPEAAEEEITAESDFEKLIMEAAQQSNFRLAIRYHYLQTLHKLAANNFLQLAADKTNYQYVRELTEAVKQNEFAGLTLNYEYVWYGEFAIDNLIYQQLKNNFTTFDNKI